jgi:hypothetical protein
MGDRDHCPICVSLNQYITYALARQASLAYSIQPVAEDTAQQQKEFAVLLQAIAIIPPASSFSFDRSITQFKSDRPHKNPLTETITLHCIPNRTKMSPDKTVCSSPNGYAAFETDARLRRSLDIFMTRVQ